jgi:uncharacterized RDD family membrane protein YckC
METAVFVLKIVLSISLSMVALASLLRGSYLWFQLWRSQGESYTKVALMIAKLNLLAGGLVSLTVFLWNPAILILLVFLGFSVIGALTVYQMVASPYQLASWWRRIDQSRRSQSDERTDEGTH